ncbi:hypothetical protein ACFLUF_01505 [Chloroflexota bacterium]
METISFVVLILLSLVGYSAGAVGKAGNSVQLKPKILDLIVISIIWAGAIYSRMVLDSNRWLLILAWVVLSSVVGMLAVWPRKLFSRETISYEVLKQSSRHTLERLWQGWKDFSKRMGEFQSRIVFSLLFFILISPFALAVKAFSDPLGIKKHRGDDSYWLLKIKTEVDLGKFRRQF